MYFKFGVDSFIWTEKFSEKDLWTIKKAKDLGFEVIDFAISDPFTFPLEKVKAELDRVGIECVCTTTLTAKTNPISPDPAIRTAGVKAMKKCVDICNALRAPILGGVNYAGWGYITKKPRTRQEWEWGVSSMRESAEYAKRTGNVAICVECVNRFETFFLNIAEDAVRFCKDVGTGNMKVHLDCFHMIREEKSFSGAVKTCGKEFLGYMHVNENDRGIRGQASFLSKSSSRRWRRWATTARSRSSHSIRASRSSRATARSGGSSHRQVKRSPRKDSRTSRRSRRSCDLIPRSEDRAEGAWNAEDH